MPELEAVAAVRDFVERGGNVLLVIAFVTAVIWAMIYERFWYYRTLHRQEVQRIKAQWRARQDHSSWSAHQIRRMWISDVRMKLQRNLGPIQTFVKICPMLGLLGTVTGMIEVFDVMATGSGNARGMAGGVSKATLPTMAGMVAAISGMLFSVQLSRFATNESARVADSLDVGHG
ncbi:MAG: MotA/TolQ/ExbB proton channel family protein [Myxococcota bacterium]